jgi:DNA replication and repair protein RecF
LLDEVAAHLDEPRRAALYDEICTLGSQAVMTGTEATLFDALGDRAQVMSVSDNGAGSAIGEG